MRKTWSLIFSYILLFMHSYMSGSAILGIAKKVICGGLLYRCSVLPLLMCRGVSLGARTVSCKHKRGGKSEHISSGVIKSWGVGRVGPMVLQTYCPQGKRHPSLRRKKFICLSTANSCKETWIIRYTAVEKNKT